MKVFTPSLFFLIPWYKCCCWWRRTQLDRFEIASANVARQKVTLLQPSTWFISVNSECVSVCDILRLWSCTLVRKTCICSCDKGNIPCEMPCFICLNTTIFTSIFFYFCFLTIHLLVFFIAMQLLAIFVTVKFCRSHFHFLYCLKFFLLFHFLLLLKFNFLLFILLKTVSFTFSLCVFLFFCCTLNAIDSPFTRIDLIQLNIA